MSSLPASRTESISISEALKDPTHTTTDDSSNNETKPCLSFTCIGTRFDALEGKIGDILAQFNTLRLDLHQVINATTNGSSVIVPPITDTIVPKSTVDTNSILGTANQIETDLMDMTSLPEIQSCIDNKMHFIHLKVHVRMIIYDYFVRDQYTFIEYWEIPNNFARNAKEFGRIAYVASILGDLEVLKYLHTLPSNPYVPQRYYQYNIYLERLCYQLAFFGHWSCLRWAIEKQYPIHPCGTLRYAIYGGADLNMVQWLHQTCHCILGREIFCAAASMGNISIMKWLREISCEWDDRVFWRCMKHGNITLLKWLKSEGCPWGTFSYIQAAKLGDIRLLFWLQQGGCPKGDVGEVFHGSIDKGADLLTLQYLRSAGFTWDMRTFEVAVKRGDLELLKYLHKENCPWNANCMNIALSQKNVIVVQWLHQVKCPWNEQTRELMVQNLMLYASLN